MPSVYDKAYISRQVPDANPKRLIIACDGTWQSSVELDPKKGVPSNITRLCRVIASNGTGKDENGKEIVWPQIVHYDAGVGTGDHSWKGIQSMKEGELERYHPGYCWTVLMSEGVNRIRGNRSARKRGGSV